MAKAMVWRIEDAHPADVSLGTLQMTVRVTLSGPEVSSENQERLVTFLIDSTDTLQVIRQAMTSAVVSDASSLGITVAPTAIVMLEFQKGSV